MKVISKKISARRYNAQRDTKFRAIRKLHAHIWACNKNKSKMVENGRHYKKYLFSLLLKSLVTRADAQFQACLSKQSIDALRFTTRHSTLARLGKG